MILKKSYEKRNMRLVIPEYCKFAQWDKESLNFLAGKLNYILLRTVTI